MPNTFSPKWKFNGPIMPKWILKRKDISQGAKILYSLMASYAYDGSDHCYSSQSRLADDMGASLRSVQNYIRELEALELIQTKKSNSGSTNTYYFVLSDMVEFRANSSSSSNTGKVQIVAYANSAEGVRKVCVHKDYNKYKYNIPPLPPKQSVMETLEPLTSSGVRGFSLAQKRAEKTFEQFWTIWPRKESKIAAGKVWQKLWFTGRLPKFESLIEKVDWQIKNNSSWHREGGRYVPQLANWLRDERWLDEYTADVSPGISGDLLTEHEGLYSPEKILEMQRAFDVSSKLTRDTLLQSKHVAQHSNEKTRQSGVVR